MGKPHKVFVDTPRDRARSLMLVECGSADFRDRLLSLVMTLVQTRRLPVARVEVVTSEESRLRQLLLIDFTSAGSSEVDMAIGIILRESRQRHGAEFNRLGMSLEDLATVKAMRASTAVRLCDVQGT